MSKFKVTVTADAESSVEPDGIERRIREHLEDTDGLVEVEDNSYTSSSDISTDGLAYEVVVEAATEEDAIDAVRSHVDDGTEVEDYNGLTWVLSSVCIEAEQQEMDEAVAKAIVAKLLDRLGANGYLSAEEQEAVTVLLDL